MIVYSSCVRMSAKTNLVLAHGDNMGDYQLMPLLDRKQPVARARLPE